MQEHMIPFFYRNRWSFCLRRGGTRHPHLLGIRLREGLLSEKWYWSIDHIWYLSNLGHNWDPPGVTGEEKRNAGTPVLSEHLWSDQALKTRNSPKCSDLLEFGVMESINKRIDSRVDIWRKIKIDVALGGWGNWVQHMFRRKLIYHLFISSIVFDLFQR